MALTVAVKFTDWPKTDGLAEEATVVVVLTVEVTVKVAEAVFPVSVTPPTVPLTVPVVLFLVPDVVAVTLTDRLHELLAETEPPVKPTDVAPAAGEKVPPQVFVAPGVEATCTPAGSRSVNAVPVIVDELELLIVKLSVDGLPTAALAGVKDLLIAGGARIATVYVSLDEHVFPPPEVQVGELIFAVSVMESPLSGVPGAVK